LTADAIDRSDMPTRRWSTVRSSSYFYIWDNAAMESFFSSLKTERTGHKTYRTPDDARADVFDYIERFYNPKRRHSTIGYVSPMEFERQAGLA
jgi:putative transposase